MIRFTTYYGQEVWIVPERVLSVVDGGCGSRGIACEIYLDTGKSITVNESANRVQKLISEALRG